MFTNRSADDVFRARVRKEATGPTFLRFVSPTPPHEAVTTVATVLREFGKKPNAVAVKPDPDVGPVLQQPFSQPRSAMRSHSMPPVQFVHFNTKRSGVTGIATPSVTFAEPSKRVGVARSAGSISHQGSTATEGLVANSRSSVTERVQVTGVNAASSASRAGPPRSSDPGASGVPPSSPAHSRVLTRSYSARVLQPNTKIAPASSSQDPNVTGVTVPEPSDPNEYVRNKRLCQLTDEEKQRNRKGKGAQEMLQTAWFELEGEFPLRHPPDLSGHDQIQYGDVFWYRSLHGVQLWLWTEGAEDAEDFWRAVVHGVSRDADGRFLGLNPSQRPSWMTGHWLQKQKKNAAAVRVFIFKF